MKPFLSVIIPAYNEAKRLPLTLIDVNKYLSTVDYDYEIIVVDDGSKDDTAEIAGRFSHLIKNLRVIDNKKNHGKGWVVRQGMLEAKGQWRLFMDADNATTVEQFQKMIPYLSEYQIVIGSRDVKGLSCCSLAFAAAPTLYFSDLTDGPKTGWNGSATQGAAVTIWGKNFGSSRGTSHVTVGGVNLTNGSDYAEWGVSTNNARGMERITFWLNNNCANGAGIISVTVGGVTSNTAPFYVRTTGNIRFVDHTNGLNTNNGQADTAAWKTLGKARTSMIGGDIVYIRAGTYDEIDADNRLLLLTRGIAGSNNNYTAFIGYPGELPVLDAIPTRVGFAVRNNFYIMVIRIIL